MGWHIEPYFNTLIPPNGTGLIHNSWVIHTADTVGIQSAMYRLILSSDKHLPFSNCK